MPPRPPPAPLALGTFLGVYTPTVLTILGVILYLRFGWVISHAGIWGTLSIVLLANAITAITAVSLSALATNMRVGVGGAYYILSRSMGLELGGALGIPLYLSQTLSVTLYAFGLAESSVFIAERVFHITGLEWLVQPLAALIVVGVTLLAARSTMLALKAQLPIMVLIGISLVAFMAGVDLDAPGAQAFGPLKEVNYFHVFAVFFPAVTGVLAGVGMSGDLKDPTKSIPRGVLLAVATGFVIYAVMPFFIGHAGSIQALREDPLIWTRVAVGGVLFIVPGLFGAILSSAIGSVLAAPRTLQALATDGLVPKGLGRLDKKTGEPLLALRLSGGVALVAVALGDLNAVAEVVTMFFLTTYGMLNLAAALEGWIKDPSYRPKVAVPFQVSLLGAIGCFVAMAAINPWALVAAASIEGGIWWWLSRRRLRATWGDLRSGLWLSLARLAMVQLRTARMDPRSWRPHMLVFSADLRYDVDLVALAAHFGQERGIVSVVSLLIGTLDDRRENVATLARNRALLEEAGVLAFPEVHTVPELDAGVLTVAQANGFAGIDSNMMVFRWPDRPEGVPRLLRWVRHLDEGLKSIMAMRLVPGDHSKGDIVVWWKGKQDNGDLMVLLAHLLVQSPRWRGRRIVMASIVETKEEIAALKRRVEAFLADSNIETRVEPILKGADQTVHDLMVERSRGAALVFLGLPRVEPGREEAVARGLTALLDGLPSAILVRNSSPFRGRLV